MREAVDVEYGEFSIVDPGGSEDPAATPIADSWDLGGPTGPWLVGADNILMVRSEFNVHSPTVTFELWDEAPPPQVHPASETAQVTFASSTGRILLEEMTGSDEEHEEFDLGSPDAKWHARGYRVRLVPADHFPDDLDEEVESFCFQFWPAEK
ncbi:UNVERIFIED_ORG: hypothetical protein FHR35_006937 [Microbispora rosea subsp. rosea]